ncbi:MAG: hypothetical protein JXR64_02930 [Spirochaetales bacterium]|nr:hypothetical protein [Spirochaetales bacterium]
MGKIGGMPYFEGPVTSNSALLSQPTSLASNIGRTGGGSSQTSSRSGEKKIPKGLPGETNAYLEEGNAIDDQLENVRLDMFKYMEDGGGFNEKTYALAQKKFAPKLKELIKAKRVHDANYNYIEEAGKIGIETIKELSTSNTYSITAGPFGELIKTEDGYLTNNDVISKIKNDSSVDDFFRGYRHPKIDELDKKVHERMRISDVKWSENPNAILKLQDLINSGADLNDPKYSNIISEATTSGSSNIKSVISSLYDIADIFNSDTDMGRTFNYRFNLSDIEEEKKVNAKIKEKNISEEEKKKQMNEAKEERRFKYMSDYLNLKPNTKDAPTDGGIFSKYDNSSSSINQSVLNAIEKAKSVKNSSFTKAVLGEIDGIPEVNDYAVIASRTSIMKDHYNNIFNSDNAPLKQLKSESRAILDYGLFSNPNLTAEQKELLKPILENTKSDLERLQGNVNPEALEKVKQAFDVSYFKVLEPDKFFAYNIFGNLTGDSKELENIIEKYDALEDWKRFGVKLITSTKEYEILSTILKEIGLNIDNPDALIETKDGNLVTMNQLLTMSTSSYFNQIHPSDKENVLAYATHTYFSPSGANALVLGKSINLDKIKALNGNKIYVEDIDGIRHDVTDNETASSIIEGRSNINKEAAKRDYLKSTAILSKNQYEELISQLGDNPLSIPVYRLSNGKLNIKATIGGRLKEDQIMEKLGVTTVQFNGITSLPSNYPANGDETVYYRVPLDLLYTKQAKKTDLINQKVDK